MFRNGIWCHRAAWCTAVAAAMTLGFGHRPALAGIGDTIEIDGNMKDDSASGPVDWCCLVDCQLNGNCACLGNVAVEIFDGVVGDCQLDGSCGALGANPPGTCAGTFDPCSSGEDRFYTGGGSKDQDAIDCDGHLLDPDDPITTDANKCWQHVIERGGPNDKTNIQNGLISLLIDPTNNNKILAFAGDLFAANGTAQIGVWLLKNAVGPECDTSGAQPWSGNHAVGDVQVLVDFTQGGRVGTITFRTVTQVLSDGKVVLSSDSMAVGQAAAFNQETINPVDTCWCYQNKFPQNFAFREYPPTTFFSAAIDLTANNLDGCFTSFVLQTRTSQSITATYKDFINGNFDTCKDIAGQKLEADSVECGEDPAGQDCDAIVGPLAGWSIALYECDGTDQCPDTCTLVTHDGNGDPITNPVLTDSQGGYEFFDLPNGDRKYIVCETIPPTPGENFNWDHCAPGGAEAGCELGNQFCYSPFDLSVDRLDRDFHNFKERICATVSGTKYCDENADQTNAADPIDPGLEGFCIVLTEQDGTRHCDDTAAATGAYVFNNITSGQPVTVHEDLDGSDCRALGCTGNDNSADWVATTATSDSVNVPAGASDVPGPNFGNTTRPVIECPAMPIVVKKDDGECEADVCFDVTAENLCGDVMIDCTATGPSGETITLTGVPTGFLSASPPDGVTVEVCGTFPGPDSLQLCADGAITEVTCTVRTEAWPTIPEAEDECSFSVEVQDNTPPTITGTVTGEKADAACDGTVTLDARVTDNCCVDPADVTVTATLDGSPVTPSCTIVSTATNSVDVDCTVDVTNLADCEATVEYTVNAADCCDNAADPFVRSADVTDNTDPTITGTVTGEKVDSACDGTVTLDATVTDNCCVDPDDVTVTATVDGSPVTPSCTIVSTAKNSVDVDCTVDVLNLSDCEATVEYTVNATDCCGRNAAPTFRRSADVTDNIDPTITGTVTGEKVDTACDGTVTLDATVTDNCCVDPNDVTVTATADGSPVTPSCTIVSTAKNSVDVDCTVDVLNLADCNATIEYTVNATDCCGSNAAPTFTRSADVNDNIRPAITGTVTGEKVDSACDGTVTLDATVTDNCCVDPDDVTVTATADGSPVTPSCTIVSTAKNSVDVDCTVDVLNLADCNATVEYTVNATDCCGGNAAPTFTRSADVTDNTDPTITGGASGGKVDDLCDGMASLSATVTDNCCVDPADVSVSATVNGSPVTPSCSITSLAKNTVDVDCSVDVGQAEVLACPANIAFTVNADDCCGNSAAPLNRSAQVTDNLDPTIDCKTKIEARCNEEVIFVANAADNCDKDPTCDCTFSSDPAGRFTVRPLGNCEYGVTLTASATVTATCTATDLCDNTSAPCSALINATCNQACSPGFWRNHDDSWCAPNTPFNPRPNHCFAGPATTFLGAFGLASCSGAPGDTALAGNPGLTLLEAVSSSGGNNQTLFHCSAALLSSYAVSFPVSPGAVEDVISDACSGIISWTAAFDACKVWNAAEDEGGCPLSGSSLRSTTGRTSELKSTSGR